MSQHCEMVYSFHLTTSLKSKRSVYLNSVWCCVWCHWNTWPSKQRARHHLFFVITLGSGDMMQITSFGHGGKQNSSHGCQKVFGDGSIYWSQHLNEKVNLFHLLDYLDKTWLDLTIRIKWKLYVISFKVLPTCRIQSYPHLRFSSSYITLCTSEELIVRLDHDQIEMVICLKFYICQSWKNCGCCTFSPCWKYRCQCWK